MLTDVLSVFFSRLILFREFRIVSTHYGRIHNLGITKNLYLRSRSGGAGISFASVYLFFFLTVGSQNRVEPGASILKRLFLGSFLGMIWEGGLILSQMYCYFLQFYSIRIKVSTF